MRRRPSARRAVAMLLVLVSLMMATVITAGYMASRDNSPMIGSNVALATEARWAARSAVDLGVAILETQEDWRTRHDEGKLLEQHPLGRALIDIDLVDADTGAPPTASTTTVNLTAVAVVDGVAHSASAAAEVEPAGPGAGAPASVDLREFVIFTRKWLKLKDSATIARWSTAPASANGQPVALGTQAVDAGSIAIEGHAAVIDGQMYYTEGASALLVTHTSTGPALVPVPLGDQVPVPAVPTPPTLPDGGGPVVPLSIPGVLGLTDSGRYASIASAGPLGLLNVMGDVTLVSDGDVKLGLGAGMVVDGQVTLVVNGKFELSGGSFIELMPGASLNLFVRDHVTLSNAYVGDVRADRTRRDNSGSAEYMDPMRIVAWGTSAGRTWTLGGNSVVKGSFYLPDSSMVLRETSAVYGRMLAETASLKENGAIFYDHAMDGGNGYTAPDCPLFGEDGSVQDAVAELACLNPADLAALADSLGIPIAGGTGTYGAAPSTEAYANDPDQATPRPVRVTCDLTVFGCDPLEWESRAVTAATAAEASRADDAAATGTTNAF
jgi:hypothetical protein